MALHDDPAFIDFILKRAGKEKLIYVGHSQGTTQMFIGSSMKPDYFSSKVSLFVALAPVARLSQEQSGALWIASQAPRGFFETLIHATHLYNLLPKNPASETYAAFCEHVPDFCASLESFASDYNKDIDNTARLPDHAAHSPAGSGWRNLIHYAQIIKHKKFLRFDYGETENKKIYGTASPPEYDLTKITTPMALFHGDVDTLADPGDVKWLLEESGIPSSKIVYQKQYHLGHASFQFAKDMAYFDDVLKVMKEHHSEALY